MANPKRVLITGAGGFIGHHFLQAQGITNYLHSVRPDDCSTFAGSMKRSLM
jgi:hypothetical protein